MRKDIVLVYVFENDFSFEKVKLEDEINRQYNYLVQNLEFQGDGNGNGTDILKIFNSQNEVLPIHFGKWQLLPIIEMPFSWTGFSVIVQVIDPLGISQKYRFKFDDRSIFKKNDFICEVKGIFQKMKEFEKSYLSHEHYELRHKCEELTKKNENLERWNKKNEEEIQSLREKVKELTTTKTSNLHVHRNSWCCCAIRRRK
ncbi:MAG: hypothetical protein LBI15_11515 [Dysgonamonadaceae bacterium]|jgi:FtsZ-binding cell division protein ZapB|nr:hypothetical protein [Dysgonamonadaceae bacterium]